MRRIGNKTITNTDNIKTHIEVKVTNLQRAEFNELADSNRFNEKFKGFFMTDGINADTGFYSGGKIKYYKMESI